MNGNIHALKPFRWKCFQVLIDESENVGDEKLRNAHSYLIADEEYESFLSRHSEQPALVPEPNHLMKASYFILDEYLRFLSKEGDYLISRSILEVGVHAALRGIVFREDAFIQRGGVYDWTKDKGLSW